MTTVLLEVENRTPVVETQSVQRQNTANVNNQAKCKPTAINHNHNLPSSMPWKTPGSTRHSPEIIKLRTGAPHLRTPVTHLTRIADLTTHAHQNTRILLTDGAAIEHTHG